MKKKRFKILAGILLLLLLLLLGIPYFLESRMGPILRRQVNAAIKGTFDFSGAELSLVRNFPNARLVLEDANIITEAPFKGDTLLTAERLVLVMGLGEVFKTGDAPYRIRAFSVAGADLRLKSDAGGRVNYELFAEGDTGTPEEAGAGASEPLAVSLEAYTIENTRISYQDEAAGYTFVLDDIRHSGSGDLSLRQSDLMTHTSARMSFVRDSLTYMDRHTLQWDALLGIDLSTNTYTLKENSGRINRMPLELDGHIRLLEQGRAFQLTLRTPDSDFKNLLGLMPEAYAGKLQGLSSSGQFRLDGAVNGIWDAARIPAFRLEIGATDGAFRYEGMAMGVDGIQLEAVLGNTSGLAEDTFLEVPQASFNLEGTPFALSGEVRELGGNPRVRAAAQGSLELGKLSEALPALHNSGLQGSLQADLQTIFDYASVAEGRYQDTRTTGFMEVQNLEYPLASLSQPLQLRSARAQLEPGLARLTSLEGTLGGSDFSLEGTLRNTLGYALGEGVLEGVMTLRSHRLDVADFRGPATASGEGDPSPDVSQGGDKSPAPEEPPFRLPGQMDLTASFDAGTLIYDDLEMAEVTGTLRLKDRALRLSGLRSRALDGRLAVDGLIATGSGQPRFDLDLDIRGFRVAEALETLELMQTLVPVAALLEGTFNTRLNLSGTLQDDFSPELGSLTGKAVAELLSAGLSGNKAAVADALSQRLDFFDAETLDLKGLKTVLAFEDGRVAVSPFSFAYQDIGVSVSGGHTFDQQLDYTATFEVPARYLGPEVNRLLSDLRDPGLGALRVPVTARIRGAYNAPDVQTDLSGAVSGFTRRLVALKKQQLLEGGKAKAREVLGDFLNTQRDSAAAGSPAQEGLKALLEGVRGDSAAASPADSTTARTDDQSLERAARDLLGGLLGKGRDTTVRKDTVRKDTVRQERP